MLAVPLWILYELGIILAGFISKAAEASDDGACAEADTAPGLDKADAGPKQT